MEILFGWGLHRVEAGLLFFMFYLFICIFLFFIFLVSIQSEFLLRGVSIHILVFVNLFLFFIIVIMVSGGAVGEFSFGTVAC